MATGKKEIVKLNDDGWWECDNETFFSYKDSEI
jgi:hypothetical protein